MGGDKKKRKKKKKKKKKKQNLGIGPEGSEDVLDSSSRAKDNGGNTSTTRIGRQRMKWRTFSKGSFVSFVFGSC